jgi:hypothetical protein
MAKTAVDSETMQPSSGRLSILQIRRRTQWDGDGL